MWSCVLCKTTSAGTGFQIPHFLSYVFRIPKPRIPDPISKNFPDSGLYKQKFSSIPDHYKQKFSRFRIVQAKISWIAESKFPFMGQLFQSLRNGFILNRLQQWLSWVTKNGICTHGILSVSGVTRSPTRAPTTSPPWQFFFKQNRSLSSSKKVILFKK